MSPLKSGLSLWIGTAVAGGIPAPACAEPTPGPGLVESGLTDSGLRAEFHPSRLIVRVREGISLTFERGEIRIGGDPGSAAAAAPAAGHLGEVGRVLGVRGARAVFDVDELARPDLARRVGLDRYYVLELDGGVDALSAAGELGGRLDVFEQVGVDRVGELHAHGGSEGQAPPPMDPEFGEQWGLHNKGQEACGSDIGRPGADIHALGAWGMVIGTELSAVTVAIVDAGVNEHADLAGRLVPGLNCADGGPGNTGHFNNNHGTHMAGVVAAIPDNGVAIAGVSWNAFIMPIRIFNDFNIGFESEASCGIIGAADRGADVINMSFGFGPNGNATSMLHDAVLYAYESGAVLVASSGNSSSQTVRYPAAFPEVIAVGATDNTDNIWSNSTSGPELALTAPGVDIRSLRDTPGAPDSTVCDTGTSPAAAFVSGVAALVLARHPELSNDALRAVLEASADDLGPEGRDDDYGWGRVNAEAALALLEDGGGGAPIRRPTCLADLTGDRVLDISDILLFLQWFSDGDLGADLAPPEGVLDFADIMAFLQLFVQGACTNQSGQQ